MQHWMCYLYFITWEQHWKLQQQINQANLANPSKYSSSTEATTDLWLELAKNSKNVHKFKKVLWKVGQSFFQLNKTDLCRQRIAIMIPTISQQSRVTAESQQQQNSNNKGPKSSKSKKKTIDKVFLLAKETREFFLPSGGF